MGLMESSVLDQGKKAPGGVDGKMNVKGRKERGRGGNGGGSQR